MCQTKEELSKLPGTEVLRMFRRSIELEIKNSGNGKTPFDSKQLFEELEERLTEKENSKS